MVGFCHLTDSHHYHHGQEPTMVGICHGGNMPVGQNGHDDAVDLVKNIRGGQVLSQVVGGGEETTTPFSNIFPTTTLPTLGKGTSRI